MKDVKEYWAGLRVDAAAGTLGKYNLRLIPLDGVFPQEDVVGGGALGLEVARADAAAAQTEYWAARWRGTDRQTTGHRGGGFEGADDTNGVGMLSRQHRTMHCLFTCYRAHFNIQYNEEEFSLPCHSDWLT